MRAASLPLPILVSLASFALYGAVADAPGFLFPEVPRYGGVVALPEAAEQPRSGMKLVFDIVSDTKPEEVNKGLESVARYLNLNAQAGHKPSDVKLALVLHGNSTKAAMHDAAFARHTSAAKNPSTELIRELKRRGVELFVCGQSLARNKFPVADVAPEFTVAASALTVNANRQQDGYSYVAIH